MRTTRNKKDILLGVAAVSTLSMCYGCLLAFTWLKWGSLLVDTFLDFRVVMAILDGASLYSGTFHTYGILPPYILALVCKIFGLSILAFVCVGILTSLLAVFLIYQITFLLTGRMVALFTSVVFLFVFAFGNYQYDAIYNFILPYTFATAFCLVAVLSALHAGIKYLQTHSYRFLVYLVIALFLSFLCRIDMTVPVYVVLCFVAIITRVGTPISDFTKLRKIMSSLLMMVIPVSLACIVYATYILCTGSGRDFLESSLGVLRFHSANTVHASLMFGTANLKGNLRALIYSCGFHVVFISTIFLVSVALSRIRIWKACRVWLGLFLPITALVCLFLLERKLTYDPGLQYRCMPFICLAVSVYAFVLLIFNKKNRNQLLILLFLSLVSLALIARILLTASPASYGAILMVPGLILYHVFLFEILGGPLNLTGNKAAKTYFTVCLMFFLGVRMAKNWSMQKSFYESRTVPFEFGKDKLFCYDDEVTKTLADAVEYLKANTTSSNTLISFPECEIFGYFSRTRNPINKYFTPLYIIDLEEENRIVTLLVREKIDYIVLVHKHTAEQGAAVFGVDYAQQIYAWMLNNYDLDKQFGAYPFSSEKFGVAVFKRKSDDEEPCQM